jgi:hypothetical protein
VALMPGWWMSKATIAGIGARGIEQAVLLEPMPAMLCGRRGA